MSTPSLGGKMPGTWSILVPAAVAFLVGAAVFWRPLRAARQRSRLADARRSFHWQRERLEIKFIQLAWDNAGCDGPRWADCEFDDDVSYVRSRNTRELSAFVRVTIALEAGEFPLHHDPLQRQRWGTAIFRFDRNHWETDGRAILDLSPAEAIRFYRDDLEVVGEELVGER